MKKFSITFVMHVDEDNNFLSSYEEDHVEDVEDLVSGVMYDVDDVKIESLNVKETK